MCSEVREWKGVQSSTDDFKKAVFPDPEKWLPFRNGDVFVFIRGGMDVGKGVPYVTHGTPLSILYEILREGIRVGPSTHRQKGEDMAGWFCIDGGRERDRIECARYKSKSGKCTEFQRDGVLSGWTVPCVLAWEPWPDTEVTHLKRYKSSTCHKSCIEGKMGKMKNMPPKCAVFINKLELDKYRELQELGDSNDLYMICGGKRNDNLYCNKLSNNMAATCGNAVLNTELEGDDDWSLKESGCWFCTRCNENRCKPNFWSDTLSEEREPGAHV